MIYYGLMTVDIYQSKQRELWDKQHQTRGTFGPEGKELFKTPNKAAVILGNLLNRGNLVLEIGSANGRDARYLASVHGIQCVCLDFSRVALSQLAQGAKQQEVSNLLHPLQADIQGGSLPLSKEGPLFHGFYSRSSLHLSDRDMVVLAKNVCSRLHPGAIIVLEGKSQFDPKIQRSVEICPGLVIDPLENNHMRRVWTESFARSMCEICNLEILQLLQLVENTGENTQSNFMRLVAKRS